MNFWLSLCITYTVNLLCCDVKICFLIHIKSNTCVSCSGVDMLEFQRDYIRLSLGKLYPCNFSSGSMGMPAAKYWHIASSHAETTKFTECLNGRTHKNCRKYPEHMKSHSESRFEDTLCWQKKSSIITKS